MSVKVIFKEENEDLFWQYWQKYLDSRNVSSRYLQITLDHNIEFSKLKSLFVKDKSFVYVVNNEPAACVFLPIEKRGENLWISHDINGGYVDAPLFADSLIEKKLFTIIDDIAKENNVAKVLFTINPIEDDGAAFNYLQKYNYLDTTILRYIIDLNISEDLLAACRKGLRLDIKKILDDKNFSTFSMDQKNSDYGTHEEYRILHHRCAGGITRPKKSFDQQFERLKAGKAVLFGLKYKRKNIAFSYFDYNADKAIYFSGADDPDYAKFPIYHALIFSAMEYFKKIGVRYLDPEQPACPSMQMDYYPDAKQLNIAFFKRGFGGYFLENFRGIKYFSRELFKKDMENFEINYSENINRINLSL